MKRVLRYQLDVEQRQMVQMPEDARVISVGVRNEHPCVFAVVECDPATREPYESLKPRIFRGATTGEEFEPEGCAFVGSVYLRDWFAWHIFEQREGVVGDIPSRRLDEDYDLIRRELS